MSDLDPRWDPWGQTAPIERVPLGDGELRVGDAVRLRPRGRADIMDLALAGRAARVQAIERDFEDEIHVAVVVDDDPGRDLGELRQPGHRFFFRLSEIEPLRDARGDFVPPSETPLLSGTLGGPAVRPSGPGSDLGAHREDGLTRSGEAHSYSPHLLSPRQSTKAVLVAGIGNVFLGDDGFGVEVVSRLAGRPLPEGVEVADYGLRGYDLACALLEDYRAAVLVDAVQRGLAPGTLALIEPDVDDPDGTGAASLVDGHGLTPARVLSLVRQLGGRPPPLLLVGCEPATFGPEEGMVGLSPPVEAAVDEAVRMVESLARRLASGQEVS